MTAGESMALSALARHPELRELARAVRAAPPPSRLEAFRRLVDGCRTVLGEHDGAFVRAVRALAS